MKRYRIYLYGSEDTTSIERELTPVQLRLLQEIAAAVSAAAPRFGPTMEVKRIDRIPS